MDDLDRLDAQVLVISFGTPQMVRSWAQEVECPFRVLLDQDRKVYQAYGLKRSWIRSWGPKSILGYASLILRGRKWRGIRGDSTQLGGDFVVGPDRSFYMRYPSKDPTDRPPVADIVRALQKPQYEEPA